MVKPSLKSKALSVVLAGTLAFGMCPAAMAFAAPAAGNDTAIELLDIDPGFYVGEKSSATVQKGKTLTVDQYGQATDAEYTYWQAAGGGNPTEATGIAVKVSDKTAVITVAGTVAAGTYYIAPADTEADGAVAAALFTLTVVNDMKQGSAQAAVVVEKGEPSAAITLKDGAAAVDLTTAENVEWDSADTKIATIASDTKKVTGVKEGTTSVTCTFIADGTQWTYTVPVVVASLEFEPTSTTVAVNKTISMNPVIKPEGAGLTVKYTLAGNGTEAAPYISNNGAVVRGLKTGGAPTITGTLQYNGKDTEIATDPTAITVVATEVDLSSNSTTINLNELKVIDLPTALADSADVTQSPKADPVLKLSAETTAAGTPFTVTGIKPGVATVTVATADTVGYFTITVENSNMSLPDDAKKLYVGQQSNLTKALKVAKPAVNPVYTWEETDKDGENAEPSGFITITDEGVITAIKPGTAYVTVTENAGGVQVDTATFEITVMEMGIEGDEVAVGETAELKATYVPADYKVTKWEVADTSIATIDNDGKITGVKEGEVEVTATATLAGAPDVTAKKTIKVVAKKDALSIDKIAAVTWNGKEKKPAVTVKAGDKTLKAGTDYTVKYEKNTAVGIAKAVVTGKGDYAGLSAEKKFKISPAKIGFKLKGAKKAIKVTINTKSKAYKKANMDGYQVRVFKAGDSKHKDTTVKGFDKKTTTIKGLKANTKYKVYLRTIKTVDGTVYHSKWSDKGYYVTTK